MNLRTYRARTMGDALAEVKKDLGKDAVILHTRTYKVGGWFGLGSKPIVEVTASDKASAGPRPSRNSTAAERPRRAINPAAAKAYGAPAFRQRTEEPALVTAGGPPESD